MYEELTQCFKQVVGSFSFRKRLLVWDTFEAHTTEKVKLLLKEMKVESAFIQGGCTKYIQAPDVYWKKPFKGFIAEMYGEWLANGWLSSSIYRSRKHETSSTAHSCRMDFARMANDWKELIIDSFH